MSSKREIKFRGKAINSGEWVYGYYIADSKGHYIVDFDGVEAMVDPDTVGQFSGLLDKNWKEIYESDIVTAWSQGVKATFTVTWRQGGNPCWILYPAWQNGEMWSIAATEHKPGKQFIHVTGQIHTTDKTGFYDDGLEVIGQHLRKLRAFKITPLWTHQQKSS